MTATLKLIHKAVGAEVRRHPYEVLLDGKPAGSVNMNESIDIPITGGTHTLQIHSGRDSSRTVRFDVNNGETVAHRCTGKRFLPVFLASFIDPELALVLIPETKYN